MGKESAFNERDEGDAGLIAGSGKSPGGGNGYSVHSENPMDRGAWWAIVHGVTTE